MDETAAAIHCLKPGRRIWVVSFIYGQVQRLMAIHKAMANEYKPGDQIIYLGNYLGFSKDGIETMDELLLFRRALLASAGTDYNDIVYLKGRQEEYWRMFLQLYLSPDPEKAYTAMLADGLDGSIKSYNGDPQQGLAAVRTGSSAIAKWVDEIRTYQKSCSGHYDLLIQNLYYAAVLPKTLLFVSSGVDPDNPLEKQREEFWAKPAARQQPYPGVKFLVHGEGLNMPVGLAIENNGVVTVNGSPEHLSAVLFDADTTPARIIEV